MSSVKNVVWLVITSSVLGLAASKPATESKKNAKGKKNITVEIYIFNANRETERGQSFGDRALYHYGRVSPFCLERGKSSTKIINDLRSFMFAKCSRKTEPSIVIDFKRLRDLIHMARVLKNDPTPFSHFHARIIQ